MRIENVRKAKKQGMNWISQEKRLAIYLRDGLACAYCGKGIEEMGSKEHLTLDHIKPYIKGGSHKETNLVTCCNHCNSVRRETPLRTFCKKQFKSNADEVEKNVRNHAQRDLKKFKALAKDMIELRGSCKKAIDGLKESK